MKATRLIQNELKLIDSMLFAVYNPFIGEKTNMSYGKGRWQIRKWLGIYPKRLDLWNTDLSEPFLVVCKEAYSPDLGLYDDGYKPIGMDDISDIRKTHWFKIRCKEEIAAMDRRNDMRNRFEEAELDYQSKYYAKKVWRIKQEPTINLSGKEWRI